jgi:3-deoxy-manno-octulosonate cytidylyltransferase (CMP-KDO synthetase)
MTNKALIIIPARFNSKRFPGKVLEKVQGKPVLWWVYDACKSANVGRVLIATDNTRIESAVKDFGAEVVITPSECSSGSDRVYFASKGCKEKFVVNVQGDELFVSPETIRILVEKLESEHGVEIATPCSLQKETADINDPNSVKAVFSNNGRALYFSRSAIPHSGGNSEWYKHLGVYAYTKSALERFANTPPSKLEKAERLEQLRALENGMNIHCVVVSGSGPSINTPEDLKKAEEYLSNSKLK